MKAKKMFFLWLFVLLTTTAMIVNGQTISVSVPSMISEYPLTDKTDQVVNVRAGTTIRLVANPLSSQTQWSSNNAAIIASPILNPAGNTMDITVPVVFVNGDEFQVNVFFAVNLTQHYVKFIVNNNPVTGLLSIQQNIQECPGIDSIFTATTSYQTGFNYTWQEFNGTAWGSLLPSSYYSSVGYSLNIQTQPSNMGKRFRCIIKNDSCFGGIDTTAEVIVQTVYALPNNQIPTINGSDVSVHTIIDRGECQGVTIIGLKSSQTNVNYQLRLYDSPYTLLDTQSGTDGATITFAPQPGMRCKIVAVSLNGCEREIVK